METLPSIEVRVHSITSAAEGIHLFELRPLAGALPAFEAGERHRYVLGIHRDRASRGGSAWLHDSLRVADRLTIGTPRNHFPLDETARHGTAS